MTKILAISGGGWNSFSAASGFTAGLLDRDQPGVNSRSLEDALKDYSYASGNSGGTWFIQSLLSSNNFKNSLENKSKADTFNQNGFTQQVSDFFRSYTFLTGSWSNDSPPRTADTLLFTTSATNPYGYDWQRYITDGSVFALHKDVNKNQRFSGTNFSDWADGKEIVFAGAAGSYSPWMDTKYDPSNYYAKPFIVGQIAWDTTQAFSNVKSDLTNNSSWVPLNFSVTGGVNNAKWLSTSGENISLEITNNSGSSSNRKKSISRKQGAFGPLNTNLLWPTSVSSAAAAALTAPLTLGQQTGDRGHNISNQFKAFSPLAFFDRNNQLSGSQSSQEYKFILTTVNPFISPFNENWKQLQNKPGARMGDGVYTDNTSVAHVLSEAEHNNELKDGFEITILHNNSGSLDNLTDFDNNPSTTIDAFPNDLLAIFGLAQKKHPTDNLIWHEQSKLWTVNPHVFNASSIQAIDFADVHANSPNPSDGHPLIRRYDLNVESVNNDFYNIPAGVTGTVTLISTLNPTSNAQPEREYILDNYKNNYTDVRDFIASMPANI